VGTSSAAISNFEAGNNSPTLGTLVRIAAALQCAVTALVRVLDEEPEASGRPKAAKPRKRSDGGD
jgi:transcriptional regulator with XRE-family HTH domain